MFGPATNVQKSMAALDNVNVRGHEVSRCNAVPSPTLSVCRRPAQSVCSSVRLPRSAPPPPPPPLAQAFAAATVLLTKVATLKPAHGPTITQLVTSLKQVQQFVKLDYAQHHCEESSQCGAHCLNHAFSPKHGDEGDASAAVPCTHAHTERCQQCDAVVQTFHATRQLMRTVINEEAPGSPQRQNLADMRCVYSL